MLAQIKKSYHILPSQNESVKRWKGEGKRVFGCTCSNIPEELIYAAGILPVRLLGTTEEVVKADSYCAGFVCYIMRSILELGLKGELADLDGIVVAYTCEGSNISMQPMIENVKFSYCRQLLLPHSRGSTARTYYLKELTQFKKSLEEFTGKEITDESLSRAIELYNENRSLLRRVYDLRGGDKQPKISGSEAAEIIMSSMLMPKDEHNRVLSQLLAEIPDRKDLPKGDGPRLHLCGTILPPDLKLFELVEELGGLVVSDDICLGSRYFWGQVDTSAKPLEALASYYLDAKTHCPFVYADETWSTRADFIKEMVSRYKADGVLVCNEMWCDPFLFHRTFLMEDFKNSGVPALSIEVERDFDIGPLRTRIQALFEMIEERKK